MTWSYSRITAFETCPYGWFLKYIRHSEDSPQFFSQYGKFAHKILERYFNGLLTEEDLLEAYTGAYTKRVYAPAPTQKIYSSYFRDGMRYFNEFEWSKDEIILGVEKQVDFSIEGIPFIGFLDLLSTKDDNLIITDHKSTDYKPREKANKKDSSALDDALRQMYVYAIPTALEYGKYPATFRYNCFRKGNLIKEPFDEEKLNKTKAWVVNTVETIRNNADWEPKPQYWKCNYICGMCNECDYRA